MRISLPRFIVATLTALAMMAGPGSVPALADEAKQIDLSITQKDDKDPVVEKTFVTYSIVVSNLGPQPANGIVVGASVTAGRYISGTGHRWSCDLGAQTATCDHNGASLDQGSSTAVLQLVVQAPAKSAASEITHTANVFTVKTGYQDVNPANNSSTETTKINKGTDLQVDQADEPDPVTAGNIVRYIIGVINNHSQDAAANVALNTAASAGTVDKISGEGWVCAKSATDPKKASCTFGAPLAAGATAPLVYLQVLTPFSTSKSSMSNTAVVSASSADTTTSNNTDVQTTTINPASDGTGTDKTVSGYIDSAGGQITTCNATGTTSTDPTCTTAVFPAGPGGVASLTEGDPLDICARLGCAGGSVDVVVPNGYDFPTTSAIRVFLYVDKETAPAEDDPGREIYFEKPANPDDPESKTEALALPACTGVPVPGVPCVASQGRATEEPFVGDFLGVVELYSQDPLFDVGDGLDPVD